MKSTTTLITSFCLALNCAGCDKQPEASVNTRNTSQAEWAETVSQLNLQPPAVPDRLKEEAAQSKKNKEYLLWMDAPKESTLPKTIFQNDAGLTNKDGTVRYECALHFVAPTGVDSKGMSIEFTIIGCDFETHSIRAWRYLSPTYQGPSGTVQCKLRIPHKFQGPSMMITRAVLPPSQDSKYSQPHSNTLVGQLAFPISVKRIPIDEIIKQLSADTDHGASGRFFSLSDAVRIISAKESESGKAQFVHTRSNKFNTVTLLQQFGPPDELIYRNADNLFALKYGWLRIFVADHVANQDALQQPIQFISK